jgi:hypothetical protein
VLLLEEGSVLVQFADLIVLELVGGSQLGELLVEEGSVGLVLAVQRLLFARQLGQRRLDGVHLGAAARRMRILCQTQLLNRPIAVGNHALQLFPAPLEFPQFKLDSFVSIGQESLKLSAFVPESLYERFVVRLDGFDVDGVQTGESLLHIEQLLLIFPLPLVDLLAQQFDLLAEFLPLASVVFEGALEFYLQVGDLGVLDLHQFAQAVEFSVEALVLLAHILPQVAQLGVEELLELASQLIDFLVLLLHHRQEVLPVLAHYSLQTLDLRILFPSAALLLLVGSAVSC